MNNNQNKLFYKNKRILLTGHTGFKGAWFSCVLQYLDVDAIGFALKPEENSLYSKISRDGVIKSYIGDIRDFENLKKVISDFKPEIIFHLAAFGFIKECFDNPKRAYETNVIGTVNVLEAVRDALSVKSLVIVSTDKVYSNDGEESLFSEKDALGGDTPYSLSKTCADMIASDYIKTYFQDRLDLGVGIVRASNVLGGGDHIKSRLIPSILDAVGRGEPVEIRNPNQTRPWQSVLDALDGYLTIGRVLYENPKEYTGTWNIGPNPEGIKSVGWIYEHIRSYFEDVSVSKAKKSNMAESANLGLDITKAKSELDWEPKQSLEKILKNLVEFYRGQMAGKREYYLCMKQIEEYYGGKEIEVE